MKNQNPNESIFKKKGFYVALYSCLGVVMVIAVAVSFNNLSLFSNSNKTASKNVDFNQMKTTSQQNSYFSDEEQNSIANQRNNGEDAIENQQVGAFDNLLEPNQNVLGEDPLMQQDDVAKLPATTEKLKPQASEPTVKPEQKKSSQATPEAKPDAKQQATPQANPQANPDASKTNEQNINEQKTTAPVKTDAPAKTDAPIKTPTPKSGEKSVRPKTASKEFTGFSEEASLQWPVFGDIVMQYSDKHAIYDKTLNQYRTNDVLCIAGNEGDQVVSAYEGYVVEVGQNKEDGNFVVIDNGNGYMTTYSQLQDRVLVNSNDYVEKGQVIGGVGSPSIYSVLLGNHLGFKVTKDEVSVDPSMFLE